MATGTEWLRNLRITNEINEGGYGKTVWSLCSESGVCEISVNVNEGNKCGRKTVR